MGILEMKKGKTDAGIEARATRPIDKQRPDTAASTSMWATVGEIAVVYSRSPALNHYALADMEWLILPAVLNGQFYVVKAMNDWTGLRAPSAVATWAFVSPEVDARLLSDPSHHIRVGPGEWKCGEIGWIVGWGGDPPGVAAAIAWLKAGPFKDRNAKIVVRELSGLSHVAMLDEVAAAFN